MPVGEEAGKETTAPDLAAQVREAVEAAVSKVAGEMQLNFHTLQARVEGLQAGLGAAGTKQQEEKKAPALTDQEINEAIQAGENPAAIVRRMIQAEIDQRVGGQVEQIRRDGFGAVAGLTKQSVLSAQPYYQELKVEVDKAVASLPPEHQINPEMVQLAYNMVVGQHSSRIVEMEVRKRLGEGGGQEPGAGGTGRARPEKDADPWEEVQKRMGDEAVEALKGRGNTPDSFAKKMGYESWKDYQEKTKKWAA